MTTEGRGGSYGPVNLKVGKRRAKPIQGTAVDRKAVSPPLRGQRIYPGGAPEEEIITFDNSDTSW